MCTDRWGSRGEAGRYSEFETRADLTRRLSALRRQVSPKSSSTSHATLTLLLISKSASDLLSKWVGDTKKNLASAFEEASPEDAILFFGEGR